MIKKKRVIGFILVLLLIIVGIVFFIVSNRNSNAFSVSEKKWIENNKNNVIDIAVLNDLPYFGVNGEGIFFDYITALEKETGLKFNLISYNVGEKPLSSDFAFKITSESGSDDSSFYTDNYVVLGSNTIFNVSELQGKTVGILKDDINLGSYYLEGVTLTSYDDTTSLLQAYAAGTISYAVIPYLQNIKTILAKDYNIAYQLNDMSNKYVITANSKEEKLNSILKKYFNTWMEESYAADYKVQFMDYYFMAKGIDDQTKATLLSKTYTYGYTSNLPYEKMASGKLVGINSKYLRDFADLTGVQFIYKKYSSLSEISSALKNGKIDISFGYMTSSKLNATLTPEVYKSEYVVLTNAKNSIVVDSLKSLNDSVIKVIADSSINSYLKKESKATIKSYTTIGNLLGSLTKNSIVMIDRQTYDYYKDGKLKNFTVVYENKLNSNYGFEISNKKTDEVFSELFSYYVNSINKNGYLTSSYNTLVKSSLNSSILSLVVKYILYVSIGTILVFYILFKVMSKKKVKKQIKKEDKLKFVDMLTSLKNRNYLNYNMTRWDKCDIYPQAIIIIDLNNVQYINDNFGHEEGDNVIVNAANILINSQLENSDIIRTDGNEFLVYLVGHKEEETLTYIRKLNKEFKGLTHGFGAAVGYSIIRDGITTIDDAINEATLDMRTNKESLQD